MESAILGNTALHVQHFKQHSALPHATFLLLCNFSQTVSSSMRLPILIVRLQSVHEKAGSILLKICHIQVCKYQNTVSMYHPALIVIHGKEKVFTSYTSKVDLRVTNKL